MDAPILESSQLNNGILCSFVLFSGKAFTYSIKLYMNSLLVTIHDISYPSMWLYFFVINTHKTECFSNPNIFDIKEIKFKI